MGEEEGFLPFLKSFDTICIHHSQNPEQWKSKSVVPHIVPSTVFQLEDAKSPKNYTYSRTGNPTRTILQSVLSALNKGKHSLCFSSGISALIAVLGLLNTGQHIISSNEISGDTYEVLNNVTKNYDISTTFTNFNDLSNVCEAIRENTKVQEGAWPLILYVVVQTLQNDLQKMIHSKNNNPILLHDSHMSSNMFSAVLILFQLIWAENPTDPTLNVIDICSLAQMTKEKKILLAINNTYLTPYLQRPLELGADIVMQSLTKYMNGHSDIIMGNVTVDSDELRDKLYFTQTMLGMIPAPFDCYQVIRGLKTLNLRMDQYLRNSVTIAKYLGKHPCVEKVIHPGLNNHPQHNILKSQASGHSGLVAFYIKGGLEESKKFVKGLKLFTITDIAGGCESTIQIPHIMSHKYMTNTQKTILNINENLIKMSVGLENICDLILDIEQSLDSLKR